MRWVFTAVRRARDWNYVSILETRWGRRANEANDLWTWWNEAVELINELERGWTYRERGWTDYGRAWTVWNGDAGGEPQFNPTRTGVERTSYRIRTRRTCWKLCTKEIFFTYVADVVRSASDVRPPSLPWHVHTHHQGCSDDGDARGPRPPLPHFLDWNSCKS